MRTKHFADLVPVKIAQRVREALWEEQTEARRVPFLPLQERIQVSIGNESEIGIRVVPNDAFKPR